MKPQALLRLALHCFVVNLASSLHAASVIQFTAASFTVAENVGQATLTVQRTADLDTPVSVDFTTADGSATNGLKYTAVSGTLTFGASETNKIIVVPILNNGFVEGTKSFQVLLTNPSGGAVLGARATASVLITDNDSPLKVEFATYEAREGEAAVVIGVLRGDDGNQTVTVDYATAGLTARAGTDYMETTGTLSFASGERIKLVSISILNDALNETNKTFRFTLSNASGSSLGTQKTATITLKDNDPGVGFVTGKYYIHENEDALRVNVRRGNDLALGPFTVDYATVDGTARAGQDYVATNGTLAFAVGELSRTFEVPIINDKLLEADENFQVVLSNVSGDASLGAVTNLTVILCDATGLTPHGFAAIHREPDGVVKLTFTGGVSQRFQPFFDLYPLEVSTNLMDWQALALLQRTNSATSDLTFVDPEAVEEPMRFYRVVTNHFTAAYPKPTGPYPVGRIDRLVTDSTRRNRYGISTNGSFAISIWYPAAPTAGQRPARWFEEIVARDTSSASSWAHYDTLNWFDRLPFLWTYSFSEAPLAEVSGAFPVVLFSPGFSVNRRHDSEKLEGLASHGYVVVAVDHYHKAWHTVWPDGFYYTRSFDEDGTKDTDKDRVSDLVVVLDELTNWSRTDARFAGRLDLDKVGAMGMSSGGGNVARLGQQDARCKAVVLLDPCGPDFNAVDVYSTPSLEMDEDPIIGCSVQDVFAGSKTNAVALQISNTDHAAFSNGVIFSSYPPATNLEAVRTINAYALSFFNKWLKGQDDRLHEGPSPDFPRVINFRKK